MRIAEPLFFWGFLILPLLVILFFYAWSRKKKFMARFAQVDMMKKISNMPSPARRMLKMFLVLVIFFFLILALVRPQWGQKMELVKRKGLDIMLVQDVSLSMLADDIKPNRLTRSRHEISDFLSRLTGDRVGLIAFAGEAQLLCPLTLDYSAARIFLNELSTDWLLPGTDIATAMETGLSAFKRSNSDRKYQVMILLTDGEEHNERAIKVAEQATDAGITIYTIGIGSTQGVPIPLKDKYGNSTGNYKKDRSGNVVTTRLEQKTLQKIAFLSGGKYYHASPGDFELKKILEDIADRERKDLDGTKVEQYQDRYQIPLFIAMLLLALDSIVSDRKWRKKVWKGRFQ